MCVCGRGGEECIGGSSLRAQRQEGYGSALSPQPSGMSQVTRSSQAGYDSLCLAAVE
eukprot:SAG11_NODE_2331_length_3508_cov_1.993838_2_plen_57_part_00